MQVNFRSAGLALSCAAIIASPAFAQNTKSDTTKAAAQNAPQSCDAGIVLSENFNRAAFSLQRGFREVQGKRDAFKDLKDAIHILTTPTPAKVKIARGDSIGRPWYLGQAYILLLQVPGVRPIGRRVDYGIAKDSLGTVDLLAAADTAFTEAQATLPTCAGEIVKWRQQRPWLDLINTAITAQSAGQFDTAAVLAKRSLLIDRSTPYPYSIMANAANHRKDYTGATALLQQILVAAGTDTTYADLRLSTINQLASTATLLANATAGSDKNARVQEAITDWQNFIPLAKRDIQVANAEQQIMQLYQSIGDTADLTEAYKQVIADPSKFGEQSLLNAGVAATRAKKREDATKLFTAVLDQNPNQRDALNNLAASSVGTTDPQKIFPLVDRLVSLDPNNPDSWRLYSYSYTGLLKGTKDPKQVKAYTDSLVKYNTKADQMMTVVSLSDFSHMEKSTTLGGTIENRSTTPQTYTMVIEFLDNKGTTINTQTVNVGPVAPKGTGTFKATAPLPGVVAFRYKPLP